MSELREKFDQLPQDFDRMAIWNGIEKPKRQMFPYRILWVLLLLIGFSGVFWGINQYNKSTLDKNKVFVEKAVPSFGQKSDSSRLSMDLPQLAPIEMDSNAALAMEGHIGLLENEFSLAYPKPKAVSPKEEASFIASNEFFNSQSQHVYIGSWNLNPGVDLSTAISSDFYVFESADPGPVLSLSKVGRNRLSIRAGLGRHQTTFVSAGEEDIRWREKLEEAQLDYSLGLRYEREFKHQLLFSLSTTYKLYKDNIQTSYLRETEEQKVLESYELYNHYHLFTAQVELGRRFYLKDFFWDVSAGLGLQLKQITETDFFVSEGELASEVQIGEIYTNSRDVYTSLQTAIGRQIGDRIFIRTGLQLNSGIDLSAKEAPLQHRMGAGNAFVEAGIRF
ncbi:MAG: hypothetical protein MRZ79_27465 [Bacteroidia bacterium]|nr:hypothetical protein [Bacteroidia bacterium]